MSGTCKNQALGDELELLRRITDEGLSLQVRAEHVIEAVHEGRPLGEVAGQGGPLVRSLFALEEQLPQTADRGLAEYVSRIRAILRYEAELLHQSMELLALMPLNSPRLEEQRRRLTGFGPPAEELTRLADQLNTS